MTIPAGFAAEIGGHPLIAEVLWRRGLRNIAAARGFLDPDHYSPAPPSELPDMAAAVSRIRQAIDAGERIRIWGDFDVDGQTSTSTLVLGLAALGAVVDYTIPDRARNTHGLNTASIEEAAREGVRLLITCDCGVTDFEAVAFARQIGLDVIVTDHHDLAFAAGGTVQLPDANAVINPKRLPDDHPLRNLPGVGVAYKVIEACALVLPGPSIRPESLVDLAALGIVADLAVLQGDTRYLLQRGLAQLRAAPRPGLRALLANAKADAATLDSDTISFQISPRLNAAGRLETAALSVELLIAANEARARPLAARIEALNARRRELQQSIEQHALRILKEQPALAEDGIIVLSAPEWDASVVGVVANTIVERHSRPAILIAERAGEVGRASGRSVPGIDIHAAIATQAKLIEGGGGHPMAAGFGIRAENIAAFRTGINEALRRGIDESAAERDPADEPFEVAWQDAGLELCESLDRLAPFGPGNPRPVLRSAPLVLLREEPMGSDGKHISLHLRDESGYIARALWWRGGLVARPPAESRVRLDYTLRRSVWQGRARAQIELVSIRVLDAPRADDQPRAADAPAANTARYRAVDLRAAPDAAIAIAAIRAEHGEKRVRIWGLGHAPLTRLGAGAVLIVATAPDSWESLAQALDRVKPSTVVLLCRLEGVADEAAALLGQVSGLRDLARKRGDSTDDPAVVARMAARICQRPETVREALACVANGSAISLKLRRALEETRAYRVYARTASPDALLRG